MLKYLRLSLFPIQTKGEKIPLKIALALLNNNSHVDTTGSHCESYYVSIYKWPKFDLKPILQHLDKEWL